MRILFVIVAALLVAGGTGFYVLQGLQPGPAPAAVAAAPAPSGIEVYVPAREIAIGTILTPEMLARMKLAEPELSPEMVVADAQGADFLTGSVARQPLPQGVPIARSTIVQPGERGFLAAVLPRGKRAITIPVDAVGSLSGLALPGDRVDLILTYSVGSGEDGSSARASQTVLQNLRVLAFDQRLGPSTDPADEVEGAPVAKTATLEVTSREAEVVTLAQTLGTLSLVLNSVRDGGEIAEEAPLSKLEKTDAPAAAALADLARPADAPRPRRLTLESDVTSTTKVQVVRGVTIKASSATSAATPAE